MTRPDIIVVATPAGPATLQRHLRMIAQLAFPVTLSRLAGLLLFVVDTAMIGRVSSVDLAYFGLGQAIHIVLMLIGIGMLIGTAIMTAQAHGADSHSECGVIWRVGVLHAVGLGAIGVLLSFAGESFYLLLGQDPDLAGGASDMLMILVLGLPGHLVFVASTMFLEAVGRPRPGVIVMIFANIANLLLNWALIHGELGLPAFGAQGAVIATAIVRWGIAAAMVIYILRLADADHFNIHGPLTNGLQVSKKLRRIGYPLGLAQGLESAAFAALTLLAGYLGANSIAGFQITMNIIAFCFMGAIGIGTATAVRVGHAVGRQDRRDVAMAGWSGLLTVLIYMIILTILMLLAPLTLAGIFTSDAAVLAIAGPTLIVAAITLIPDGAQGVLMGALRGTGDVWVPSGMHLFSFAVVMVPTAALFALVLDFGTPGLMLGTLGGVLTATVLLAGRFHIISQRDIKRL
jgi:MATE family multidrug resistance protein